MLLTMFNGKNDKTVRTIKNRDFSVDQ